MAPVKMSFFQEDQRFTSTPFKTNCQIASKELSITGTNREKHGELYFYTNELMFGPLTTECEKLESV